jgi:alkanesulfonate monooxygenase SsuD/methylene tetrahydromethanopterin reductase-like flavin-dependent oxidoreductase (luciferase family)
MKLCHFIARWNNSPIWINSAKVISVTAQTDGYSTVMVDGGEYWVVSGKPEQVVAKLEAINGTGA